MIIALFPKGSSRTNAAQMYATIVVYINSGRLADAQALMYRLLDFTLQQYYAGKLIGGYSLTTQQLVLQFETGLYCTVSLTPTGLQLPGNPTTDQGTLSKVVFPSTSKQDIVTQNGNAGVEFPAGSLKGAVLVTIFPLSGTPLNTKLDQYGPFSDVKVSPESALNTAVSVGLCLADGATNPTVFLAHNNSATTIEVLPRGIQFLSGLCGVTVPPPSFGRVIDLGKNGDFASATKLVGSAVANLFLPTDANATGGGLTGTTKSFSPFGGVDTKVLMTANSAVSQSAPAGSAVARPPSTLVKTQQGTLVAKVNVLFSVKSGDGTVSPTTAVATDANGVATLSSWTINAGSNTVQAVGTYADPSVTFASAPVGSGFPQAVTVDPTAGITFSAFGGDIVSYGSEYSYLDGGQDHDPGFEALDYSPPASWSTGRGPFGSATGCPLNSEQGFTMNTAWTINNDLTLRKAFSLPSGWNAPLTITAAIDNDMRVYVNGTDVTPNYTFSGSDAGNYKFGTVFAGFVTHENCATKGSLTFNVPANLLVAGTNVLAIRARDRGSINYFDAKVSVAAP